MLKNLPSGVTKTKSGDYDFSAVTPERLCQLNNEVDALLYLAREKAWTILQENSQFLTALTNALPKYNKLYFDQIDTIAKECNVVIED